MSITENEALQLKVKELKLKYEIFDPKFETGYYITLERLPDGTLSPMTDQSPLTTVANTPFLSDGDLPQEYFDAQHEKSIAFLKFVAGHQK